MFFAVRRVSECSIEILRGPLAEQRLLRVRFVFDEILRLPLQNLLSLYKHCLFLQAKLRLIYWVGRILFDGQPAL